MNYSCLEELQTILDLHISDKTNVLSDAGRKCNDGWFIVTDDGHCHLFDKDGNLDDIKKITYLNEKHIRKDIKKIIIPSSVTNIDTGAVSWCINLTNVTIPNNVTNISDRAFFGCYCLTHISIPDSVVNIDRHAFCNCNKLISIAIPNSVKIIKLGAFSGCTNITSMTIGSGIIRIEPWAFYGCSFTKLVFKGKTLNQVKKMTNYPWGIKDESIIQAG